MSVNQCEAAYLKLSERIFNPRRANANVVGRVKDIWKADGQFDSEELETAIKETVESCGLDKETLLKDENPSCKV